MIQRWLLGDKLSYYDKGTYLVAGAKFAPLISAPSDDELNFICNYNLILGLESAEVFA